MRNYCFFLLLLLLDASYSNAQRVLQRNLRETSTTLDSFSYKTNYGSAKELQENWNRSLEDASTPKKLDFIRAVRNYRIYLTFFYRFLYSDTNDFHSVYLSITAKTDFHSSNFFFCSLS